MRKLSLAFLTLLAAACGNADSASDINDGQLAAEEEDIGTTGDALLSNAASVWLPMQANNVWVLESTTTSATRTVSYEDLASGMAWANGLSSEGHWIGVSSGTPNTTYAWSSARNAWEPLFRFGYASTSWKWQAGSGTSGCDKFTMQRTASDLTVVTPAGTFTGARTISLNMNPLPSVRCAAPFISTITFAPGVGPISIVAGNNEKFVLKSATVGTKKYPSTTVPAGITSKLKLDALSYTNVRNTIRCITTPCPSNGKTAVAKFDYTVTNGTQTSQTWQFSSGCQYDLTVSDGSGRSVRAVSEGRFCTQALTSVTIAPGQSKTWSGQLELVDRDGLLLDGSFTAKATLIPRSGITSASPSPASAPLSVKVVDPTP